MKYSHEKIIELLCEVIGRMPIDWDMFDKLLEKTEDINLLDTDAEETILSELLLREEFYKKGNLLPVVIRHFLDHGYDVKAHNGLNGGLCLSRLCWSYVQDEYVLDAAKVLLDAGAPVEYERLFDDPEEVSGVSYDIEWKSGGAWVVYGDYSWANVLEAYDAIVDAVKNHKDYRNISSYLDCVGSRLTKCGLISEAGDLIRTNSRTDFDGSLVFWFDDKPLVIRKHIDFIVNPYYVTENESVYSDVSDNFRPILGGILQKVQYVDQCICYFDFDNGYRIIFTNIEKPEENCCGAFEILKIRSVPLNKLKCDKICFFKGYSFSGQVIQYDVKSIALFAGQNGFLVFTTDINETDDYELNAVQCSSVMLQDYYSQMIQIEKPESVAVFSYSDKIKAIRFQCGNRFLYTQASEYLGLELKLSDEKVSIEEPTLLRRLPGIHLDLKKLQ